MKPANSSDPRDEEQVLLPGHVHYARTRIKNAMRAELCGLIDWAPTGVCAPEVSEFVSPDAFKTWVLTLIYAY